MNVSKSSPFAEFQTVVVSGLSDGVGVLVACVAYNGEDNVISRTFPRKIKPEASFRERFSVDGLSVFRSVAKLA